MNSNSRSSLSSNISNVVGMFSRASMRIRNSVTDRDNTLRSIQAAQNAHKDRMDQARREKMRDQGTEESPYLDDAHSLENKPLDLQDEEHLQTQLKHICFWAWLGGKEVQDVLVSGGIFGKILDILQARLSNPLYEGSSEPSHHGFMSYVGSTLGLSQMVAVHQQGTKISSKGCVAALRAVATVCRDHLRNQSLAQQSGIVITLVEIIAHSRITVVEKKWAIHAMNAAILTDAAAQDMVLGCAKADELRSFCSHHFTDAEWASWPNNEVACLMHMLDWKP
ncbi:Hypothetical Protein FCC1311_046882 [Hondaea fermentalgiana]|uniref:Uncharacterized protein n=1 Tax=Hondaea fermentalgiana TaxID=2315210 RepID=A0A2R5GD06_9STRA|nr:Hypothetical Protein FCC1311_046882 [Hondaea fermentalgiana]|eukprot:GBG28465.1 Hypothetical Protein FCC1311_046882 [Hondaea fermentalgiana]